MNDASFANYTFEIRLPDCSKLAINRNNDNDVTICWHESIINFFLRCLVSLVRFSYWSKFPAIVITGSGVMTIFFYKVLTRNPVIENTRVWVLHSIWRLGRVSDTKFGKNVSNKVLLIAAKFQVTDLALSEILRRNLQGVKLHPLLLTITTQIRVKKEIFW